MNIRLTAMAVVFVMDWVDWAESLLEYPDSKVLEDPQEHLLGINSCLTFGRAAVNLSSCCKFPQNFKAGMVPVLQGRVRAKAKRWEALAARPVN